MVNWDEVITELNTVFGSNHHPQNELNLLENFDEHIDDTEEIREIVEIITEHFPDSENIRIVPNMFRDTGVVCGRLIEHPYRFSDNTKLQIAEKYSEFIKHLFEKGYKAKGIVDHRTHLTLFFWKTDDYEKITKALKDEDD